MEQQIAEVDKELNEMLDKHLNDKGKNDLAFDKKSLKKKKQKHVPKFDVEKKGFQLLNGVDITEVGRN